MNPTRTTKIMHALRCSVILGAIAGFVPGGGLLLAHAQNAAQQAALARLRGVPAIAPVSGVEATSVPLYLPSGVAFDTAGNLYIADTNDDVVREVSVSGIISTVAGNGDQGFAGDGGTATSAQLDSPIGIAVDASGNLYIADSHNNRIREVSGGVIQTIAGTGTAGFSGDGGPATSAQLDLPSAVAVDSAGNLYIADSNNNRIRKIAGTTITTVAGDGEQTYSGDGGLATAAGLDSPRGVAVDSAFNLYIGDTNNQRIREVTAATGLISTLAGTGVKGFSGDGSATTATLARPRGVAVDSSGSVYVADSDNNRIRTVNAGTISTLAGDGTQGMSSSGSTPTSTSLNTPDAVTINGSLVALSDTGNQRVLELQNTNLNTVAGQGSGSESFGISGPLTVVYGTGALTATFKNGSNIAAGNVTFYDNMGSGPVAIFTTPLTGDIATLSTTMLSAGAHSIFASYSGDTNNPAITSGIYMLAVSPAQLTAVANTVNLLYGQTVPALSGSLTGLLPQDTGKVTAIFASAATNTSSPGNYPITVTLSGTASINYTVVLGGTSGSVMIAKAPTQTTLGASSASSILGSPITFTATVASTTTGTPTGTVSFFSGSTPLNTTPVSLTNGIAALKLSTLSLGGQSITAVYSGDTNFSTSTSNALPETVIPSPDFTISATPTSQTVLGGASASYSLSLTPVNSTFVNAVSLSLTGLPAGVTATFTPSSIAAGSGASTSTLVLATSKQSALLNREPGNLPLTPAMALLLLPLVFNRRFRRSAVRLSRGARLLVLLILLGVIGGLSACGGHNSSTRTSLVTITAVSGSVTHTTIVSLTVQ
jgi:sugar lactone lactonase YvrE